MQNSVTTSPSVKNGDPALHDGTKNELPHHPMKMSGAAGINQSPGILQSPRLGQGDVVSLFMVHVFSAVFAA